MTRRTPSARKSRKADCAQCGGAVHYARRLCQRACQNHKIMIYALGNIAPEFLGDYYVADNATVIGHVRLHHNASVWFNAVLRGDHELITIGENSNVQDGAVLHTDDGFPLTLGRDVVVGHMAMLHGCTVHDNALIGLKCVVMNGAVVGKNCIVGANALIPEGKTIPDGSLVLGSPARFIRMVTEQEIASIRLNAQHYVANFKRYKADLKLGK